MKVEVVSAAEKKVRTYPKLMQSNNSPSVCWALNARQGIVIKNGGLDLGYSFVLMPSLWHDFEGSITLSND